MNLFLLVQHESNDKLVHPSVYPPKLTMNINE